MPHMNSHHGGIDFRACEASLVWATERDVEPHRLTAPTRGDEVTIAWFLERGTVTIDYPNERVKASAGEWIFPRAVSALQHFDENSRILSLRFHLRIRGGAPLFVRRNDLVVAGEKRPALESTARALVGELSAAGASPRSTLLDRNRLSLEANFRVESAFHAWLSAYVATMTSAGEEPQNPALRDERVTRVLSVIEGGTPRDRIPETTLARLVGLSVNQLTRVFVKETGLTPLQYRERLRLERGKRALESGALPIKRIAFELGFSSSSHFSAWFAKHAGKSPRDYRRERGDPAASP